MTTYTQVLPEKYLSPPSDADLEAMMEDVEISRTSHGYPQAKGKKLFVASLKEFPGFTGYGITEADARSQLLSAIRDDVATADQDRLIGLKMVEAHVQFNHRITLKQKLGIVRRAEKAGVSTRQFVLNQCLLAPEFVSPEAMPEDEKESGLKKMARVAAGRKRRPQDQKVTS